MKIAIDGRRIIRQSTGLGLYTFHLLKAILEAPGENE